MTLQTTNVAVDLGHGQNRNAVLVFVHELQQIPFADDNHPATYLHLAALLPLRQTELRNAEREGRNVQNVQAVVNRVAVRREGLRARYEQDRMAYRDDYVRWVETAQTHFDVVVCCPSSRDDAEFYLDPVMRAVRRRNPEALDLSTSFSKEPGFKVGTGVTVQQAREHIKFDADGRLDAVGNVLIIDDAWARGTTVGVVLGYLAESGLQANAQAMVFVPLWIRARPLLDGCEI